MDEQTTVQLDAQEVVPDGNTEVDTQLTDEQSLVALMTMAYPKGLQAISWKRSLGTVVYDGELCQIRALTDEERKASDYRPGFPSMHKSRKARRTIFSKARRGLPVSPVDLYMAQYSKFIVESVKKLTTTKGG